MSSSCHVPGGRGCISRERAIRAQSTVLRLPATTLFVDVSMNVDAAFSDSLVVSGVLWAISCILPPLVDTVIHSTVRTLPEHIHISRR